jgi:hypothetical protein
LAPTIAPSTEANASAAPTSTAALVAMATVTPASALSSAPRPARRAPLAQPLSRTPGVRSDIVNPWERRE